MSTETVILFGFEIARQNFINAAGLFGGFFPAIVDLMQRQSIEPTKRAQLCKLFYSVKLVLIPICALIITAFATSSGVVTSWLAALYLGATFPILAQKAVTATPHAIDTSPGA